MTPLDIALGLLVVLIWGVNFVVIKLGVSEVPPLALTALRFLFAALPAVFFVPRPKVALRLVIAYGIVLGVIKFGLLFVAMKQGMPAGLSSLVLQMQAFFTVLFAATLLREKPLSLQVAGGALALAGLGVIASGIGGIVPLVPFLMTIAAAAFWGVANVIMKRAGKVDMLGFVVWASLFAPLPLLALSLLAGEGPELMALPQHMTWRTPLSVLYLAYPTTLIGFGLFGHLLSRYPASLVAPFTLLVPLVGLSSGALLLGETIVWQTYAGGALIVAGLAINVAASSFGHKKGA